MMDTGKAHKDIIAEYMSISLYLCSLVTWPILVRKENMTWPDFQHFAVISMIQYNFSHF